VILASIVSAPAFASRFPMLVKRPPLANADDLLSKSERNPLQELESPSGGWNEHSEPEQASRAGGLQDFPYR